MANAPQREKPVETDEMFDEVPASVEKHATPGELDIGEHSGADLPRGHLDADNGTVGHLLQCGVEWTGSGTFC